jgi:DNA-binding XRE family transcriptional regulator
MMNDVERLHGLLVGRFPDLKIEIDPPEIASGAWFVNVFRPGLPPVVVEWRPDRGFGLATPGPDDYGTGVDEVFTNAEMTFARVVQLVLSGGSSVVPLGVRLMEIRQSLGITQAELAATLGHSQAGVSKAEKRDDMQLGTLAKHAAALGATVSVRFHLPDGRVLDQPVLPLVGPAAPAVEARKVNA